MARTVSIGTQNFEVLRTEGYFYIDKTSFLSEWWEGGDNVTLITRPRRFGKTLNMSMTEQFFSVKYAGRSDLFQGLSIWESEKYRKLQGTYPVISLSFADVKETTFAGAREKLCQILQNVYMQNDFLRTEGFLKEGEEDFFRKVALGMSDAVASYSLKSLSACNEEGIWSLLLASGYLKVLHYEENWDSVDAPDYELTLTNREVRRMFATMVRGWFGKSKREYNGMIKALLADDLKAMNYYMNKVALATFSYFDMGKNPSDMEPERFHGVEATTKSLEEPNSSVCFYHGFVLGLLVELSDRCTVTFNRESGFGRYDVVLEPKQKDDGIILEFKVQDMEDEKELSDTVQAALKQIEERGYETALVSKGVPKERIRKYGFAFCGKKVLIGR